MQYCRVCKHKMLQYPLRMINSLTMVEYYCPNCSESKIKYVNFKKL
jgi:hypothetical protein